MVLVPLMAGEKAVLRLLPKSGVGALGEWLAGEDCPRATALLCDALSA